VYSSNKINLFIPLVLVTLILFLSSCSERSEYGEASDYEKFGAGSTDTTAPTISSVSPTNNSINNSPDTTIAVTFSEAMSTGTISTNTADTSCSGSFQLSANSFTSCIKMTTAPTASNSGKTFSATPSDNLSGITSYKLKITTSVTNTSSNSLASAYISDGFFTAPSGSGIIRGSVKQYNGSVLSDVTVSYAVSGINFANTTSDSSGDYSKSTLNNGAYTLSYSKDGYLTAIQSATIATTNQTLVAASQTMISTSCTGGDISGIIKDAVTGNAIQGVSISIRSGLNVRSGDTISGKTDTTDSNGAYTLSSMDAGSYTIEGSKSLWISTYFNVRSCTGASGINSNLSEQLAAGAMRIVLSWVGEEDFDSHLEIPCTSGTCDGSDADDKSHLWYGVNQGGVNTNDYHNYTDIVSSGDNVTLDQDNGDGSATSCGSGCGPETITISKIRTGTYRYHVYAFDQSGSTSSKHIADNGTVVQVFYNNSSTNFDVPSTVGNLWTVFDFDKSTVSGFNTLNTMSNEDTDDEIDDH